MARKIAIALLVVGAVLALAFWGLDGLLVFVVLAFVAGAVAYALSLVGEWLQRSSGRRFDDEGRRR